MPAKRFPISNEAIAAAAWLFRWGRRTYRKAGEPFHPSLRQVIGYLVRRGLVDAKSPPPPVTLARALKRAGHVIPPHWRSRSIGGQEKSVVAGKSLCSSVDDGSTTRSPSRRAAELRRPTRAHPWHPCRPAVAEEGAR